MKPQQAVKGGTIINARAPTHENQQAVFTEIEPEKEIVIILSEREMTMQYRID